MPRVAGSRRGRSGKASGGQTGHEGDTLRQVADCDCVLSTRRARAAIAFGSRSEVGGQDFEKRQVFDLAERPLVVTEHHASIYRCAGWRDVKKAAFPDGLVSPTQYGDLHGGVIVHDGLLRYRRLDRSSTPSATRISCANSTA